MKSLPSLFERWTGAQASKAAILAALALDSDRRRGAVLAYVDGEAPTTIAGRLGIRISGLHGLMQSSMRACYRRIYGASLPMPHPDRPSREKLRTGYRTDKDLHAKARMKVTPARRKKIARMGARARAAPVE